MQSPRASASPEPRRNETDDQREFKAISTNTEKMHEYRMSKLRESLKDARKTNWIHVGNAFRDPLPPHSSKP
ncbi:uncharacterized protein CELE_Y47D3A.20 [Caenorhabditis elegans]|uniref:Uncharacterized protein n=1 Tax=Caenorhabditis elegans TaxID=6239 RepID=Q7YXC5_CAEEL|nr:Uncharacterized protein CELE_Y47D3A.20 [Caenorhabditis elegans]CAD91710.2 Uncharacterized protein CELE_Y47D3A.20 [Caenorhabditis elegans]|eukprot:NP_001022875.2 Uncharacterized protein CELE_Y47D3A.20 [Caenorhabditis elegans]